MTTTIAPHIFKAYDIRGTTPTTVNADVARAIGQAFGTLAKREGETTVAVGRDGRLSGPALVAALIEGLQWAGVDVIDVGMVTTPQLYFAAFNACGQAGNPWGGSGIQVTGSHNPRDDNGFKMVLAGRAIYGDTITGMRDMIAAGQCVQAERAGTVRLLNIQAAYSAAITNHIVLKRPLKLVVDSGNGVAGASAPAIFRAIGCEVVELYSEVDGNFPNHHPDPSKPENLADLKAAVAAHGAELGFAFDGDGDRLGVVTNDGELIFPDRQMMLFAADVLSRVPGAPILFDVKCSQRLAPAIEAAGGVAEMFKTGHSLIKARMKELNSPLGGEMSGHIFFKERWFGFDDGTYAGCRLAEILSAHTDASAVLRALPSSHSTPELNVSCAEGEPHRVVAQLQTMVKVQAPAKLNTIDGLRIDWPDGFGLIRASNTTPVLSLRFEGHTSEALHRIEAHMVALLKQAKPDAVVGAAAH
jgi:phosphomannomutase